MKEQFTCWVTTTVSSWDSPPTLKTLRRTLTKMAKLAPESARITVERKDDLNGTGKRHTQIAAQWSEWK